MDARALSSLIGGRHAVTYDTFWLVPKTTQAKTSNKITVSRHTIKKYEKHYHMLISDKCTSNEF
jgi:hypothetical protein